MPYSNDINVEKLSWEMKLPFQAKLLVSSPMPSVTSVTHLLIDLVRPLSSNGFAIVIGWKAIIKAIFPKSVDGDLLKLVHLSNGYKMITGAAPLKKGDVVSTKAEIKAVLNQPSGEAS